MTLRVLADLHHAELYYSLQLLFEKRLGAELYRPIGMDWYHEGYWKVYPHIATVQQFLGVDARSWKFDDGTEIPESARINNQYTYGEDGIYYVNDPTKDKINRAITLAKFKEMKFDILVSSIPAHIPQWNKLIQLYQPTAKHIFQVGNAWGLQTGVRNILSSTAKFDVPKEFNACFYHQEFDTETFKYEPANGAKKVKSFIHYMKNKGLMNQVAALLPDWEFRSYGAGMEDHVAETSKLADSMRDSSFVWHYKPEGDGYGHVIHNAFAVGRPPLIWAPFYKGKCAEALIKHEETCLDLSLLGSASNIAEKIKYWSENDRLAVMSANANRRFREVVNFDSEEQMIRKFLEDLR